MSDSNRRDRYALIALVSALAAIVLVVWFSQPPDEQIAQPYSQSTDYPKEHHGPAEGRWLPEFSARDTYAQWFMALLSALATGVSIWAVYVLRQTLDETRRAVKATEDAVEVTQNIGNAQIRAYVSVTTIQVDFAILRNATDKTVPPVHRLYVYLSAGNFGQTPARRIQTSWLLEGPSTSSAPEFAHGERKLITNVDIRPTQTDYVVVDEQIDLPANIAKRFIAQEIGLLLKGAVMYDPVVGEPHRLTPFAYLIDYDPKADERLRVQMSSYVDKAT